MTLPGSQPAAESWRRFALTGLVLVVVLNVAAFAVRAQFVTVSGAYAATTGFEEFCLYNIWKVAHGLPLYEWPQKEHYLLTSYNAGFYHCYAAWAKLWRADGEALVACVRWLTPLFGGLGMFVQVHLIERVAPRGRSSRAWIWGLSFLTWFGTSFVAWGPLTARPDIPAAAFALAGFALALRAQETRRPGWWLTSSVMFFVAWSFKQSVVWIFAGTLLQAFRARAGWASLLRLAGPFGALALAGVAGADAAYRYNIFSVPGVYRWFPWQPLGLLAKAAMPNLFFCGFGGWALWRGLARGAVVRDGVPGARWRAMAGVAILPLAVGVVQLALHGSSTNNILEGWIMIATLGAVAWLQCWERAPDRRALAAGAILLLTMAPLPVVQLALAARGVPNTEIRGVSIGNLTKLNAAQLAQRRQFADWMRTLPKPLWMRDAMLQLPWFATDDRYPAFPLDYEFEADALRKGVLEGDGFAGWIRRRYFACLLLRPDDRLLRVAHEAGYVEAMLPEGFQPLATEFGLARPAPRLLLRPSESKP